MNTPGLSQQSDAAAPGFFQVISLGDASSSAQQTRDYKRRRSHKKSRGGCSACKQKRVKCDQTLPTCLRCRRNQRSCVYEHLDAASAATSVAATSADVDAVDVDVDVDVVVATAAAASSSSASAGPAGPTGPTGPITGRCVSTALVKRPLQTRASVQASSWGGSGSSSRSTTTPSPAAIAAAARPNFRMLRDQRYSDSSHDFGTSSNKLLHHFETVGFTAVFNIPAFVKTILPLALRYSHLRSAVLAVAASHLCHWAPGSKENRIASHYQQTLALQAYQQALARPLVEQGQAGVDALLLTAMIINMLSFILPTEESDVLMVWHGDENKSSSNISNSSSNISNSSSSSSSSGGGGGGGGGGIDRDHWLGRSPSADLDVDPRRSWVFSTHPNRLVWLAVAMGLAPLVEVTAPWRENSSLRDLYANSDDERRILSGTWQSVHRVPQAWLDLFGINRRIKRPFYQKPAGSVPPVPGQAPTSTKSDASSPANPSSPGSSSVCSDNSGSSGGSGGSGNSSGSSSGSSTRADATVQADADRLYRGPLRVLAELWPLPANKRTVLLYFQFLGQMAPEIRHRLFARDEKTLWLFGMWMGLLCRLVDVWWVCRRARCDFRAIRLWLHLVGVHRRPGAEGQLWRELLHDLDRTWGYDFESDEMTQRLGDSFMNAPSV